MAHFRLNRLLLSTALALACAGSVNAAVVVVPTVPGALDGANGVGGPGFPGGDATATAVTTDPSNTATATGGLGGTGDVRRRPETGESGLGFCWDRLFGGFLTSKPASISWS